MIPGSEDMLPQDPSQAAIEAAKTGFPLVVKAAAGGGGRGMRVVHGKSVLANVISVLQREAQAAFGDGALYAEKYLDNPRHIEVQVLADGKNAIHLGTRDCSMQRRHQKVVEEAPAFNLPRKKEESICEACISACKKIKYKGAGTFEFLYDGEHFYFIEMNTRLQVEHPVTEMITGIDIVAEQLYIAAEGKLRLRQKDIQFGGAAVECRINAEDARTFAPSPGVLEHYHAPGGNGVRVDSHAYNGYEVSPFYDSLLAKLITHGGNRKQAIARMRSALREYVIDGISTNLPLHARIMNDAAFVQGDIGIKYLESKIKEGFVAED